MSSPRMRSSIPLALFVLLSVLVVRPALAQDVATNFMPGTDFSKFIWQGRATKTLDPGASQEKTQKNLDKAMAKLLKKYPPQAK